MRFFLFYRTLFPKSSWRDFRISEVLWRPNTLHPREHVWMKYRLLQREVTMMLIPVRQQFIYHHLQDQAPHDKKMTALMKDVCTLCTSVVFAVYNNIIFGNICKPNSPLFIFMWHGIHSWIVDFVHLVLIISIAWIIADGPDNSLDSQKTQAQHYRTLQEMYKAKKPNKAAVTHLLDLEFQSRRNFIDSDALKEQDRPTKILQAYPCFKDLDHVGIH